ncbi:MAG: Mov34/MPN/PAD-1 family protein [Candidatus Hodarchaeota archaeon]
MPINCLCALSEYFKMAIFADFAAPNECSGVLAGYTIDDTVFIDNTLTLRTGKPARVELEPQDYVKIAHLDRELRAHHKFIVGWFHSHSSGIFFSATDRVTHRQWTTHYADAIGIVLESSQMRKKRSIGCFIYNKSENEFRQIPTTLFRDTNASLDQFFSEKLLNSINNFQQEIITHFRNHQETFEKIFDQERTQALEIVKLNDKTSDNVFYVEGSANLEQRIHILLNKRRIDERETVVKSIDQKNSQEWEFWTKTK